MVVAKNIENAINSHLENDSVIQEENAENCLRNTVDESF